jgi:hypothetical protein
VNVIATIYAPNGTPVLVTAEVLTLGREAIIIPPFEALAGNHCGAKRSHLRRDWHLSAETAILARWKQLTR